MKTTTFFRLVLSMILLMAGTFVSYAQFKFTNSNSLIPTNSHSGNAVTVADMNNDGLDDIVKMDSAKNLIIDMQNKNGTFTHYDLGPVTPSFRVWGMAIADVDHNGWKDVATGTGGSGGLMYLVKLSWNGSTIVASKTTLRGSFFVQNVTFGDFNNDGWADLFVCDDINYAKIYMNDGAGGLALLAKSRDTLTIGTGAYTIRTDTGLGLTNGQVLQIGFDGANYMTGTVTSYNSSTLVVNVTSVVGSGTYRGWSIHPNVVLNTNINPGLVYSGDPYDSGNYGSVWTDFDNDGDLDLYIAHCRQSAGSSSDQRRRERLFVNNGSNGFTEMAQSYGIEVTDFKQSWTTSFGDLDNDGDLDIVMTNHGENGQILENDGTGHYTDITPASGFSTTFHGGADPIESAVEDFDNDGFLDILISGGGPGDSYIMYHNNGNMTFNLIIQPVASAPFPSTTNGMLSFATGDLNHDGKMDVFSSYGDVYNTPNSAPDVLYLNTVKNNNHFITFNLTGVTSNVDAIGARVTIYGPWGKQIREVRAGESYGTANSMQLHFGLGQSTNVDSAHIDWPSHLQTRLYNLAADQFVTSVEGTCDLTGNIIPGAHSFCTGSSLMLATAGAFTSYAWSNGVSTPTTTVFTPGFYNVEVTNGSGCTNVSPSVYVTRDPDQTPLLTASGETAFCSGGSVTLNSSPSSSYLWSGGQTTQSINVTSSGNYSVTIQGLCTSFTSDSVTVTAITYPGAAITADDSAYGASAITLHATGDSLFWYDQPTGGTLLGSGTSFTTPVLTNTATYWVENASHEGGINTFTGQPNHTGASLFAGNTTNAEMQFDVMNPCTLMTVKVYSDTAANRVILLKNLAGNVINSANVNIPNGTSIVTLNFALTPGIEYSLTTDGAVNTTNFGSVSPRLQRSSSGVTYPYTVNNVLSITGSDQGSTRFYYFYDWNVVVPAVTCAASRVPAQAIILAPVGINNFSSDNNFYVYPNPASRDLTVSFNVPGATAAKVEFIDATGRVVLSSQLENSGGNYKEVFDLGDFAKGIYTVHVSTKDKASWNRVVVQ